MKTIRVAGLIGVAGLMTSIGLFAQGKTDSPAKGDEITQGFRAYVIVEPRYEAKDIRNPIGTKDKPGRNPVDLVTENGLNPVVAVFSRAIPADGNHPLAALVKKLDELTSPDPKKGYGNRRLAAFLVFLALKDEFRKDPSFDNRVKEVSQFASGVKPERVTIALAEATETPDGTEQSLVPAQVQVMGIAPEDDFTIVFYNKLRVVKRWHFKASMPPGEEDLKAIEAEIAKTFGPKK
jgi:hypothetical protein